MENLVFRVAPDEAGRRLDQVISGRSDLLTRSRVQTLFEQGAVLLNSAPCEKGKIRAQEGDRVSVMIPDEDAFTVEPEDIPLDICFEDDDMIVVNKPRGMVVHPAVGNYHGTLVNALLYHTGGRLSSLNGDMRPGIVHRIDKDTSGLLMAAKTDFAHQVLARQLFDHTITRKYIALVWDNVKEDEGTIDLPIGRDPKVRVRRAVHGIDEKRAVTHFRVLERFGIATLVECRLETGRTHQIRVHMAWMKHPLVGDPLYGRKKEQGDGQYLHARVLGFVHPRTDQYMEFEAPLPAYFEEALDRLRLRLR